MQHLKRYAMNPDNGWMTESQRGAWVRYADLTAAQPADSAMADALLAVVRAAKDAVPEKVWCWEPSEPAPSMSVCANGADYWRAMYEHREKEAQALSREIIHQRNKLAALRRALAAFDALQQDKP